MSILLGYSQASIYKKVSEKRIWKKVNETGFFFLEKADGYYNITPRNRIVLPTKVQLIISKPVNPTYHGSQNGNELDGIGYFNFSLNSEHDPEYLVFVFIHLRDESSQYMIILTEELRKRLKKNLIKYRTGEYIELRLWLIDSDLYDSTTMSLEGEYYYLSKGRGGRMIDGTIWNYTIFLNNWVLGSWE